MMSLAFVVSKTYIVITIKMLKILSELVDLLEH